MTGAGGPRDRSKGGDGGRTDPSHGRTSPVTPAAPEPDRAFAGVDAAYVRRLVHRLVRLVAVIITPGSWSFDRTLPETTKAPEIGASAGDDSDARRRNEQPCVATHYSPSRSSAGRSDESDSRPKLGEPGEQFADDGVRILV